MLKGLTAPIMVFLVALVGTSLLFGSFEIEFGTINFFDQHGIVFLFFISFFPRLTLLFSSVPFGGFLWWLGFIFTPRLLVAVLATVAYGKTNPLLVAFAWFVALSGEFMEKKKLTNRKGFVFRTYRTGGMGQRTPKAQEVAIQKGGIVEAEFTKKED